MRTKFYEFIQNNSGNFLDVNDNVCQRVIIEANDERHARILFAPMVIGQSASCECCGDRWSEYPHEIETDNIEEYCRTMTKDAWTNPAAIIHYLAGTKKEILTKD